MSSLASILQNPILHYRLHQQWTIFFLFYLYFMRDSSCCSIHEIDSCFLPNLDCAKRPEIIANHLKILQKLSTIAKRNQYIYQPKLTFSDHCNYYHELLKYHRQAYWVLQNNLHLQPPQSKVQKNEILFLFSLIEQTKKKKNQHQRQHT